MTGVYIDVSADIMSKENLVHGARINGVTGTVISRITNEFVIACGGDPSILYDLFFRPFLSTEFFSTDFFRPSFFDRAFFDRFFYPVFFRSCFFPTDFFPTGFIDRVFF